ncbi:MAG TPA: sensor histidine kinase [Panacibacter sp.]|nr:sensor histidine kinase [Panacibacter sp.]HNP43331.1 sensor histidine kinase [Panacibacter sp.]
MYKAIVLIVALTALNPDLYSQNPEKASKATLDLRSHLWARDGIADLNGEWEFYWNQLYTPAELYAAKINSRMQYSNVPEFWNKLIPGTALTKGLGYATYHLKVWCPPGSDTLALKILTISTAYRLFVNGQQLAEVGKVGTNSINSVAAYKPQLIPVLPRDQQLDIVIQVSNFDYRTGGLWDFIKLGTLEQIKYYEQKNIIRDYFIVGGFFMMGLYHLIVFFFIRRRYTPLYLGLLCIVICIRVLATGELAFNNLISLPWNVNVRLEFISMYLIVIFSVLFVYNLFHVEFSKRLFCFFIISSIAFTALALFATPLVISFCARPFEALMLFCSFYGIYISVKALRNKKVEAVFYLASFIVLQLSVLNDILYASLIIETGHYFYAGLFVFVLLQAVSLSKQFTRTFYKLNATNKILQRTNVELQNKNKIIQQKNEELSKLNRELDSFVYRVTHDLRAPITSVLGIIDAAKTEKDAGAFDGYFNMQRKTLLRLDNIISDIIDYSKNNRIESSLTKIDFSQMIDNVFEDHQYMHHAGKITRFTEINSTADFVSDPRRLSILFNNLISNAIKYADLSKPDPYIKLTVTTDEKNAAIQISDNGLGIEEKHLDKIFSMFYRATTKEQGTGLGLYIAKEVIEKLNGSISVESSINEGTTFNIIVPNNRPAAG